MDVPAKYDVPDVSPRGEKLTAAEEEGHDEVVQYEVRPTTLSRPIPKCHAAT